jgi:hypothetical protein
MNDRLSCHSIVQENFLDYDFDTIVINNFRINNDNSVVINIPGTTYLFPTYSAYGHSLVDVYGQFKILQLKYKDIKPFFYEDGINGYYFNNNKIASDQIKNLGYDKNMVTNIAKGNYLFEKVVLFFDMNNTFPEEFYRENGLNRTSHYFPFCNCYMGTEKCGESKYFKYNYLAIDMLKNDFSVHFNNKKTENIFVSREKYNNQYKYQIEAYENKDELSVDEMNTLNRAKIRYYDKEKNIEELFSSAGYKIIYAEDYSLIEQIEIFSSAKKIATISGTSLFNAFWCNQETTLFEILAVPNYRYHYKEFSDHAGAIHQYVDIVGLNLDLALDKIQKEVINSDMI